MEVYVLDLETVRPLQREALELLTPARRARALRLKRELPRLQCIGAGLLLRRFFGSAEPLTAPGGKPYYPDAQRFSLTHSGTLTAIALGTEELGLDAQVTAPARAALRRRVLTERELAWCADRGAEGFTYLWTRKEAALKCLGTGADRPLSSFCVLEDTVTLDGVPIRLFTIPYADAMLSAASEKDPVFSPETLTGEELIRTVCAWN